MTRANATSTLQAKAGPIETAIRRCDRIFMGVGLFSGIINVLALTGSFYMLQVYDRVLPSRSVPTLVGLTVLMAGFYIANGLLDFFRVRIMSRVGMRIDDEVRDKVFSAIQILPLRTRQGGDGLQPVRDLDTIRSFLSSLGPTALFDLPWVPVYLGVVFVLHPLLGLFALVGAVLLVSLTLLTDIRTSGPMKAASVSGARRLQFGETARRNAEVIRAMGLAPSMSRQWKDLNAQYLNDQLKSTDAAGGIGAFSKVLRLFLQSGILGLGAYLVIHDAVSAGTIIASSIIMSRALAPIETSIAHWRPFVAARQAHRRLIDLFSALAQDEGEILDLPAPVSSLAVKGLAVAPPGEIKPTIQNISFDLQAGDGLGIIGPSASGKSTLARALVGVWQPIRMGGSVRLDGAALDQWPLHALGQHIGYLPQDIELFEGTVAENISRFDDDPSGQAIIDAAKNAGVHEMIVHLPNGYQTTIGEAGKGLSAGQRQRIALARALYRDPFLVVLDEPNSNLDTAGDSALTEAIRSVRQRRGIVVVIAHRPSALAGVDKVLAIANGQGQAFGPKEEVLRKLLQPAVVRSTPPRQPQTEFAAPGLKIVIDAPAGAS